MYGLIGLNKKRTCIRFCTYIVLITMMKEWEGTLTAVCVCKIILSTKRT